ncbi:MAG: CRISPR-associated helicase/endonuclease Cas3 [Nitrosomonadales bacterium SCN 54-20]|mgnify:CR=1 FL=1|nr:MAG: CRISPR-associated helicase/endonuclease Cas3 [Nitrosomonadales bacterium SCN 54-20]
MSNTASYIAHQRKSDGEVQSLATHLVEVSDIAKSLAAKIGLQGQGELIGLLHDLGKYSDEFQLYLKSAVGLIDQDEDEFVDAKGKKGKVDHSTAGAQLVWQELAKCGEIGRIVGQILALCIVSHHSGLIDCLSSDINSFGEDRFTKRINKSDDRTHLQEAIAKMDNTVKVRFHELVNNHEIINGIKEFISKIVRGEKYGDEQIIRFKVGLLVRYLFSCLIDADRMSSADFEKPHTAKARRNRQYSEWTHLINRLDSHLSTFAANKPIDKLRVSISLHCRDKAENGKGIYTLTVPTGGGKTLSSIRFALHHAEKHKMDRIIYAIPFTSIIDQNADVVRKILEPDDAKSNNVVLEHHSNLMPEEENWKTKMLVENWDAPIIYTTNLQILETLFGAGTRSPRRLHQLANAVLVFDEIQTLPVNCIHLFCNAINYLVEHCGTTVVLCTATQPLMDMVEQSKGALRIPQGNEVMPDVGELFRKLKRVEVLNRRKPGGWSDKEVARLAMEETKKAGSCLVIVNTKKSAQALFQLCREEKTTLPIYHLSTNMCPAHRRLILDEIRERLKVQEPILCISTQLIEAGVDVDFGAVIRSVAGLDSIAQAAGRCNRNGWRDMGYVHVVNLSEERVDMLADIACGQRITERLLDEFEKDPTEFDHDLIGPTAIACYFKYYFAERRGEMDYPVGSKVLGHDDTLLNLLAGNARAAEEFRRCQGSPFSLYLRQSFMAAAKAFKSIDAPTRGVIVPYGSAGKELIGELCGAFEVEKQFKLLRRAQKYTVNVFPHQLEELQKEKALHEIQRGVDILYLADSRYYNEDFGLSLTPEGRMEVHCV